MSKNIVYTLAFRLLRICSTREILERRLEELQNQQLKPRNYRPSLIKKVFDEILKMDRKEALKKKKRQSLEDHHSTIHKTIKHLQCPQCQHKPSDLESLKTHLSSVHGTIYSKQIVQHQKKDRIIVPMTYDPRVENHGRMLKKHYTAMITKNEHLKKSFTAPLMPALRQPPNLRNIICKSKLFDKDRMETSEDKIGWQKCENKENAKNPCRICAYTFDDTKEITSKGNNTTHTIKGNLSVRP